MKLPLKLNLVFFFLLLASGLKSQSVQIYPFERYTRIGDNMEWAEKDFEVDTSEWLLWGNLFEPASYWVRYKIQCGEYCRSFIYPGIEIGSLGSYELYWDGHLIARNGKVGKNKAEEVPGKLRTHVLIPDSLLYEGIHSVAFRVSNHHLPKMGMPSWNVFFIEEFYENQQWSLKLMAFIYILAGIYLMAGVYYLLLYLLRKRELVGLIFSILCFLFFSLLLAEYWKIYTTYLYPIHITRLVIIYVLTLLLYLCTPLFFMHYFNLPRKKALFAFLILSLIIPHILYAPVTDMANQVMAGMMWVYSFLIALYAFWKKQKGSAIILISLLVSGIVVRFNEIPVSFNLFPYDINLFVGFSLLVIAMMYLLAYRASEQRQAYEASLVLSSRLQNELLKKNIQPHFIMNTLTSLMEWVEESPKDSVQFIEALAGEFEIMSDIAEQKLIPISQELELCQRHIQIMRFRKEIDYRLEVHNIDREDKVPPALFHTLLENGISHSYPDEENQIRMELTYEKKDRKRIYTFRTIAKNRSVVKNNEGTGLKYIKSRLQENYADQWRLSSNATTEGWITIIEIFE